jgi:hypothetical protein
MFVLRNRQNEELRIHSRQELIDLQHQINDLLGTTSIDYIRTVEAQQIVQQRINRRLHLQTLNMACQRGSIPNARKVGGRWEFPREEFLSWFNAYVAAHSMESQTG